MEKTEHEAILTEEMYNELKPIHANANCKNCPSDWFFPAVTKGRIPTGPGTNIYNAKQICSKCKVKEECYDFAYKHRCLGIWGGVLFGSYRRPKKRIYS